MRRGLPALLVGTLFGTLALGCSSSGSSNAPRTTTTSRGQRPSILVIVAADLDTSEIDVMPNVKYLLAAKGATFDRFYVDASLPAPSLASTLRGQYAHDTGVKTEAGANGGFAVAYKRKLEHSTVNVWLHDAGYRTGFAGEYLAGYPSPAPKTYVPPGWDDWVSPVAGTPASEYDYTLNVQKKLVRHARTTKDYGTDVYVRAVQSFITSTPRNKPFYAQLDVYAPQVPAIPAAADAGGFGDRTAPRPGSYDQADVSKQPKWLQKLPPLRPAVQRAIDKLYRLRLASLQAVDRGVGTLLQSLDRAGRLDNTYVVFTSADGYHLGQHRLPGGKETAYEPDINVPCVVRGPNVAERSTISAVAGNIDLAPTFAAIAGAKVPAFVDGRSLLPWLDGSPAPQHWRQSYLVEHWRAAPTKAPAKGGAPVESDDPDQTPDGPRVTRAALAQRIPEYRALRTDRYLYVEYATGERELYDVTADPDELHDLAATAPKPDLAAFHKALGALARCAAATCGSAEDAGVPTAM